MSRRLQNRKAYSLLEVVAATFLLGLAIVPAMNFMTASIHAGYELERWNQMNLLAVGQLEQQIALSAAQFQEGSQSGTFPDAGLEGLRFTASRTTSSAAGGIEDQLMVVSVTVWEDESANASLDSTEPQVTYVTKVAKMAVYQDEL